MRLFLTACLLLIHASAAVAADARWGRAQSTNTAYPPEKVLYDLYEGDTAHVSNILDRISMLQNVYGADPFDASIVVVIHGTAIPVFAIANAQKHETLMTRAASLIQSGVIQFRVCGASAKMQGYSPKDLHGFVSVIPMADAEIVQLQKDGYAYMQ